MQQSIARRLSATRKRCMVGRESETTRFRDALAAAELPFIVLNLFGPGGIGKTTLIRAFADECLERGIPCCQIDGRQLEATPEAFARAVASLRTGGEGRQVLLVDTFEALEPLEAWLRDDFLPGLSAETLVVVAGRNPLSTTWRGDSGWMDLVQTLPLRNLSPEASRTLLAERAVPEEQHEAILAFTHGFPLALSLATEMSAATSRLAAGEPSPDIVRALLERFVTKVPSPEHRAGLEVCALARVTTESLLSHALDADADTAAELFSWLRDLSFVDIDSPGLAPHAVARDALVADLKWRNPERYADLHRRIRDYYGARLERTTEAEQQRLLWDYIFLHRENPVIRSAFTWSDTISAYLDTARPADREPVRAMTEEHEGPESATLLARWWDDPAATVAVVRQNAGGPPLGFLMQIALERAEPGLRQDDPATRNAWAFLERNAPLRAGETSTYFRYWMDRDLYHGVSPVQSRLMVEVVRHYLVTPGLSYSFFPVGSPRHWEAIFEYAETPRCAEADFGTDGRTWGVFSHDWRVQSPAAWLAALGEKELRTGNAAPPPARTEALLVLSEDAFAAAVREAIKYLDRPDRLTASPLLRSRVIVGRAAAPPPLPDRAAALQKLLRDTMGALRGSVRQERAYRALQLTYLTPAATQERAAEALDLPFSTYRRHLGEGIASVTEALWHREIGAAMD